MRVLVTGAASEIGRATCLRLARDAKTRDQATRIAAVDVGPSGSGNFLGRLPGLFRITCS